MFDKAEYRANREAGIRGQEKPKPKFYPKGQAVAYVTREGAEALYPNDEGGHMARVKGKLTFLNREQSRRRISGSPYCRPAPKGFHKVNSPEQDDYRRDGLTNYQRVIRQRELSGRAARGI